MHVDYVRDKTQDTRHKTQDTRHKTQDTTREDKETCRQIKSIIRDANKSGAALTQGGGRACLDLFALGRGVVVLNVGCHMVDRGRGLSKHSRKPRIYLGIVFPVIAEEGGVRDAVHSRERSNCAFSVCGFGIRVWEELILQVLGMENHIDLAIRLLALNCILRDDCTEQWTPK
jgi:hypothetical protein